MTISEIAKLAQVSIGTVDRVLHKRGRVAPETISKVMTIVEEHGYQPNTYARNLKLSKRFTIGILIPHLHSEYGYWSLIYAGILKAAKELSPLAVTIDMLEFERSRKGSLYEKGTQLLEKSHDALLMAPVMADEARALLADYPSLDYAFIDSPLPDTNPISCVVQNPLRGGYLAGRMMHLLSPHGGTMLALQTHSNAYNSLERVRGFRDYFNDKPSYSTFEMEVDMAKGGERELESFYHEQSNVQGIFVVNDAVHRIAQTVSLLGRSNQTTLIGYDLIAQNRKAMHSGNVHCLISQRPEFQGYTAVYQLYRKGLLNQVPEQSICVPIDIILPENLLEEKSACLDV